MRTFFAVVCKYRLNLVFVRSDCITVQVDYNLDVRIFFEIFIHSVNTSVVRTVVGFIVNCRVVNRFYATLVELFGECISDCHNIEIVVVCA